MDRCDDCAYVYGDTEVEEAVRIIRDDAEALAHEVETRPDVHDRPAPETWSPLEYGCHVRDVLRIQRARIDQALAEDDPDFTPMGREALAVDYPGQDPATVAADIRAAAEAMATAAATLDGAALARTGTYHWPETASRDLRWLVRHTAHEVLHHRRDVAPRPRDR